MKQGVACTGIPTPEELRSCPGVPSAERLSRGKVAVIECIQEIPCNPCEAACRFGAIHVGEQITALPVLDGEACTGCGLCVASCPGLAIFVVDLCHSDTEAAISFPYEYHPLPKRGDQVDAVNRGGARVCRGRVVEVKGPPSYAGTKVVTVAVPREFAQEVRGIGRGRVGQ